jgi:tRNA A37 N6-isopentenylltransferase MiaA
MGSVIKKRGRPVGTKNKPKVKVALSKKIQKTVTKVNWERLAKQLQTALNDEIVENNGLFTKIDELKFQVANLEHQAIGYRAVVSYLENQIANNPV